MGWRYTVQKIGYHNHFTGPTVQFFLWVCMTLGQTRFVYARNAKKLLIFCETQYLVIFGVADYESEHEIQKFKMANPI